MKKLLGISLVAILAASPFAANASTNVIDTVTTDTTAKIAATSYVQSAYNDIAGKVNGVVGTLTSTGKIIVKADDPATDGEDETVAKDDISGALQYIQGEVDTLNTNSLTASDITTGTANGTITVDGENVSVYGLGSAAYTDSTAYDEAGAAEAVKEIIGGSEETTGKITLEGVDGSKTVQEAVDILHGGVAGAATITKLGAGASGYDINAKTLKIQDEEVLTSGAPVSTSGNITVYTTWNGEGTGTVTVSSTGTATTPAAEEEGE